MTKFFSTLSATELNYEQDVAPNAPSVLFGHAPQKLDLISIASNGALTEQSEGVYVLSALEMQQVQGGGKFKKLWKKYNGRLFEGTLKGIATGVSTGLSSCPISGVIAGAVQGAVGVATSRR
ncbi:MAG: hypothetical protein K2F85_08690 [Helicobacter sp.]|nr:hypothetical protein [Helicobacter sp.]